LEPPVPSLFGFQLKQPGLSNLAGISVKPVEVSIPEARMKERGELLITHSGLSGPVILKISAWGARELHKVNYQFQLRINWLPDMTHEAIAQELVTRRQTKSIRLVSNWAIPPVPIRLWEHLIEASGISDSMRYAELSRSAQHRIIQQLALSSWLVIGKSPNKSEFVTCGGVSLKEVNFKTMESRKCPGLYFAGELLDIDGLTGGYNFQAAWTTGWIAGNAMAAMQE
jgi:predicted Rossmann fold flavoprotein